MKKILLPVLLLSVPSFAQKTLLHCGSLIDTKKGEIRKNVTVTVEKNKITEVKPGFTKAAPDETIVDLSRKYVLPGLIDMHVHLEGETSKDQFQRRVQSNDADVAYNAQKHAGTTLRAGVKTIEHGTFLDDECIALFKEKGAYLVPTIIAEKTVADSAKVPGYYHPFVAKKALETGPLIQEAFARAYKAGVNIAFGTDAGVSPTATMPKNLFI